MRNRFALRWTVGVVCALVWLGCDESSSENQPDEGKASAEGDAPNTPVPDPNGEAKGGEPEDESSPAAGAGGLSPGDTPATLAGKEPGRLEMEPSKTTEGELPHHPKKHVEEELGTFMGHVSRFGWSADSKSFVYCNDSGADFGIDCVFVDGPGETERVIPDDEAAFEALQDRLSKGDYDPGPTRWPYGGEIKLTWKHDADEGRLLIGARTTPDGRQRADILEFQVDLPAADTDMHPELVSVSRDGKRIAIVVHAWAGEGTDEHEIRMFTTDRLAAKVHSSLAFQALGAKRYDEAAQGFERAAEIRPQAWLYPYKAASAHARAGRAGEAKARLVEAVELGGNEAQRRARTDAAFAPLRTETWFEELVD